jgi:hypothetical protein
MYSCGHVLSESYTVPTTCLYLSFVALVLQTARYPILPLPPNCFLLLLLRWPQLEIQVC